MSKDIDIFQESNQVATTNRTDGFSHTVTGSSSTSKRISIKGGMFRLVINGEELDKSEQRHLDVVIVNAAPFVSRMFFKDPYQRGVKMGPPTCWSSDAKTPNQEVELKQHENCELCPQNIKGSGANNTKACRFSRRIAVVMADNLEGDIYQVTLPALSIFGSGDDQGKPQPSVEKEQLDLFAEENKQTEPPKSDTDEVSLDDLVSDWEDKEDT